MQEDFFTYFLKQTVTYTYRSVPPEKQCLNKNLVYRSILIISLRSSSWAARNHHLVALRTITLKILWLLLRADPF